MMKRFEIQWDMRLVVTNYLDKENGYPDTDGGKAYGVYMVNVDDDKPITFEEGGANPIYVDEDVIPQLIEALQHFVKK